MQRHAPVCPPPPIGSVVAADGREGTAEDAIRNTFLPQRHKEREAIQIRNNRKNAERAEKKQERFNTKTPRHRDTKIGLF